MLTNNFLNLSKCVMLGYQPSGQSILIKVHDTQNNEKYLIPMDSGSYPQQDSSTSFTTSPTSTGWSVGRGTTAPAVTDFNLEDTITSGLSGSATVTRLNDSAAGRSYKRVLLSVTNASSSSISINEIGWKGYIYAATAPSTSGRSTYVLFYREVLPETIVLEPTKGATFTIDFYVDV